MPSVHLSGAAVIAICLIVGCEKRSVTSATTAPATAPVADALPVAATTQPQTAYMLIGGRRVEFPPAKLALRNNGGQVLALLYSDDPPHAIEDSYTGNSFYLEMILDVPDAAHLAGARWTFKAPDSERADTDSGVYLNGRKKHLQAFDVVVEIDGSSSPVRVWLSGQFRQFESGQDPTVPGQIVGVSAELSAELSLKHSPR